MEEKKLTGYPSIDKSWLKYYSEEAINAPLPQDTIWGYLHNCNKEYLNDTSLDYFGHRITFRQLFNKIEKTQRAFQSLGIKQGDIVSICMPNTPEGVYSLYALNRIGAVCNMIDPRTASEGIKNFCNETKSKCLVVISACYSKVELIIDQTLLETIIVVPVYQSMPLYLQIAYRLSNKPLHIRNRGKAISWNKLQRTAKAVLPSLPSTYVKNRLAIIAHTGGTTGSPKGAELTDDCFNMLHFHKQYGYKTMVRGDSILDIMPLFSAYGAIVGLHVSLCTGMRVILIPKFDAENFAQLVLKYKPNHVVGVPSLWEFLARDLWDSQADFSFLHSATVGGDKLNGNTEKRVNSFFESHRTNTRLSKGYGLTEISSSATYTICDACNEIESVGVPLMYNGLKIVEPGTENELCYDAVGEICLSGPTVMLKYFDNPEATEHALRKHVDGLTGLHTGDLGCVNRDGILFIKDRIKRVIFGPNGHTMFPSESERVLSAHPAVEACAVVGVRDKKYENARIPTAFIVKNAGCDMENDAMKARLDLMCKKVLPECDCPYAYVFCNSLPLTPIGKVDYRALEQMELKESAEG